MSSVKTHIYRLGYCGGGVLLTVIGGSLPQVSLGRGVDDISDAETLDRLIFRARPAAVAASDGVDMASAVFGAAAISALRRHPRLVGLNHLHDPQNEPRQEIFSKC